VARQGRKANIGDTDLTRLKGMKEETETVNWARCSGRRDTTTGGMRAHSGGGRIEKGGGNHFENHAEQKWGRASRIGRADLEKGKGASIRRI